MPEDEQEVVVVLIDGPNLNGMQNDLGWAINHFKLPEVLAQGRKIHSTHYFALLQPGTRQSGFLNVLERADWKIHRHWKDIDALLSSEMTRLALESSEITTIILVTRDGDYWQAIETARKAGKRVQLAAIRQGLSPVLLEAAGGELIDLEHFRSQLIDQERTSRRFAQRFVINPDGTYEPSTEPDGGNVVLLIRILHDGSVAVMPPSGRTSGPDILCVIKELADGRKVVELPTRFAGT